MLVAARAEVDDLDAAAALLLEQNILRFQVAVDDLHLGQGLQALQYRVGELADELQREAGELVLLDELVEIHAQELERDAYVIAEGEGLDHVYDVQGVLLVLLAQVVQDADLFLGLAVEALLVAHDLERYVLACLVVVDLEHLAE